MIGMIVEEYIVNRENQREITDMLTDYYATDVIIADQNKRKEEKIIKRLTEMNEKDILELFKKGSFAY
ncbi:MAG: hypothetical protein K6F75_09725 [Butyrivibrio sp.]|nr:hypothetical protein [Butyrivibrio sp.]